tara:strand:- start:259 stop:522 length:264 start_codon:yes stop_codon:yes gene_type:complete
LEIEALERQLPEGNDQINKITEAMIEERKRTDSVIMQQAKTIDDLSSQLQLTEARNKAWWKFWQENLTSNNPSQRLHYTLSCLSFPQ